MTVNIRTLEMRKANVAEVCFMGDLHYGSPQCDTARFLRQLNYCINKGVYIFLMGDLIELATKTSIGAGVYEQDKHGQSQVEWVIEKLMPAARKGLILGSHTGNHEDRCYAATGIDVGDHIAMALDVKYMRHAGWSQFRVGNQKYSVYSLHGRTGARFDGTVLRAVEVISNSFDADLVAMGHAHKQVTGNLVVESIVNGRVVHKKKHVVVTGSYLTYDGGYWQMVGGQISKLGSPKVKFRGDSHDLSVSF